MRGLRGSGINMRINLPLQRVTYTCAKVHLGPVPPCIQLNKRHAIPTSSADEEKKRRENERERERERTKKRKRDRER